MSTEIPNISFSSKQKKINNIFGIKKEEIHKIESTELKIMVPTILNYFKNVIQEKKLDLFLDNYNQVITELKRRHIKVPKETQEITQLKALIRKVKNHSIKNSSASSKHSLDSFSTSPANSINKVYLGRKHSVRNSLEINIPGFLNDKEDDEPTYKIRSYTANDILELNNCVSFNNNKICDLNNEKIASVLQINSNGTQNPSRGDELGCSELLLLNLKSNPSTVACDNESLISHRGLDLDFMLNRNKSVDTYDDKNNSFLELNDNCSSLSFNCDSFFAFN